MIVQRWGDDDELLRELAAALQATEVLTGRIRQLGEGAFAWHGVDQELELASLVYDSSLDPTPAVRADATEAFRTILFDTSAVSIELERLGDLLVGQVIPPEPGTISLVGASGTVTETEVDDLGRFSLETVPAEPVRFTWRTPTVSLVTDWVRL